MDFTRTVQVVVHVPASARHVQALPKMSASRAKLIPFYRAQSVSKLVGLIGTLILVTGNVIVSKCDFEDF